MISSSDSSVNRNLLLLYPRSPLPIASGTHLHEYELMRWLSRHYDITLLALAHSDAELASRKELQNYCKRVELVPSVYYRHRWLVPIAQSLSMIHGLDAGQQERRWGLARRKLEQVLRDEDYAVAVTHMYQPASDFFNLLPATTQKVINAPDVFYEREESRAAIAGFPFNLPIFERRRRLRKQIEIRTLAGADVVVTCTRKDQSTLRRILPNSVQVVYTPAVIDIESVSPQWGRESSKNVLTVGALPGRFNEDALLFLAQSIWPLVRREEPEARLNVVGGDIPKPLARKLPSDPSICVKGYLPSHELERAYAEAEVVVVAVRGGSGIKTKVIAAMGYGKAIVSTSAGVDGVDVEPGFHLLVADEPSAFARCVVHVLRDLELRRTLERRARAFAEEQYSQEAIFAELSDALGLQGRT